MSFVQPLSEIVSRYTKRSMSGSSQNIFLDLGIKSFDMMSLVIDIEKRFNVDIPIETFDLANFISIDAMNNYLQTLGVANP